MNFKQGRAGEAPVTRSEAGTFMVACIGLSLGVWQLSFNYGAYETVFAEHLFLVWVTSAAALLASLFIGRLESGKRYFNVIGTFLLMLPSLWMLQEFVLFQENTAFSRITYTVTTWATIWLALPYIAYLIAKVAVPQAFQIYRRRFVLGLAAVTITIALAGFWAGFENDQLLYCQDFDVAGNWRPDGCWDRVLEDYFTHNPEPKTELEAPESL